MSGVPAFAGAAGQRRLGTLLVVLQFAFIAVVAWLALPAFLSGAAPALAWGLAAAGTALGLWALRANPPGNFNIRPTPRDGGRLVRSGPYRWIRHPMYSCVALCAVAGAYASGSALAWLATAALGSVLLVKASFEEQWMAGRHAGYAAYRASTRRFIPGLF
jgi:protein-S-isoprenylcysteine O-methyltransferase Ste14